MATGISFNIEEITKQYSPELLSVLGDAETVASLPVMPIDDEFYKETKRRYHGNIFSSKHEFRYHKPLPSFTPFFSLMRGGAHQPLIAFTTKTLLETGEIESAVNIIPETSIPGTVNVDYLQRLLEHKPAGMLRHKNHYCFVYDQVEDQTCKNRESPVVSLSLRPKT